MNYIDMPDKFKKLNGEEEDFSRNIKAVNNSIRNILSTRKGSVPGHPEFGCNASDYLFELIDPLIESYIESDIIYAIKRWEPRVSIKTVKVVSDSDYNRVIVNITYKLKTDVKGITYDFVYSQDVDYN
jgi:phage baseplate assembly protein W